MDYKSKSYVIIIITFVLGIVCGVLIKSAITESPFEQIKRLRQHGGIIKRFENILDLSQQQKDKLKPVLDKYSERFEEYSANRRKGFRSIVDSLNTEIKPYLTKEQLQKLEDELKTHDKNSKK